MSTTSSARKQCHVNASYMPVKCEWDNWGSKQGKTRSRIFPLDFDKVEHLRWCACMCPKFLALNMPNTKDFAHKIIHVNGCSSVDILVLELACV